MSGIYKRRVTLDSLKRTHKAGDGMPHPVSAACDAVSPSGIKDQKGKLLQELDMLGNDVYKYKQITLLCCKKITASAAFVTIEVKDLGCCTVWIPKSVLRIDKLSGLWVKLWFYEKEIYTRI